MQLCKEMIVVERGAGDALAEIAMVSATVLTRSSSREKEKTDAGKGSEHDRQR